MLNGDLIVSQQAAGDELRWSIVQCPTRHNPTLQNSTGKIHKLNTTQKNKNT